MWYSSTAQRLETSVGQLNLLYVGDFTPNKNVIRLLEACKVVSERLPLALSLVGGGGCRAAKTEKALASGRFPFATWVGRIDDRNELKQMYGAHDIFVMPSIHETFGLVYLEALSQGTPVLFSSGQGISGYIS